MATVKKRSQWRTTFAALSLANYRTYWFGTLASYFASQMQLPTQAWLAYELTNSPLLLGLTTAMEGVPRIIVSLLSGVIIDRVEKRNVIIAAQASTVVFSLTIAILITTGHIQYWHLLVSSFANGVNQGFNIPARTAIVADMVPREKLYNAFALNNGGNNLARIAGPALAGVLIGFIGTQGAYYVGVGFNIIAIATIASLPTTGRSNLVARQHMWSTFKEGLQYLRTHSVIPVLLGMEITITIFGMSYQGLMPVFAKLFEAGPEGYGFMMAATGVGALVASLTIASLGNFKKKGAVLLGAGAVLGVILVIFGNTRAVGLWLGLSASVYHLAIFFLVIIGVTSAGYAATSLTIIQMNVSDEFRGRMTAFFQMVIGFYPISILIAGAAAEALGAPMALTIGGSCLTVFMLSMAFLYPPVRRTE
jgi:MFS family permease